MNSHAIRTWQLGGWTSRALPRIIAAGSFAVLAMLALEPVGTGQAAAEYTPPAMQAAPSSHGGAHYFPDRFGPVQGEIERPIEQF
jgi:hypothetical protein